jgi:3-hydroxyacyl-CoA dehydrogenase
VVRGAEWVQESLPEILSVKRTVLESLDGALGAEAIVASSTSTLTASSLSEGRPYADRMLVAHPLHPVYVVPVVELSAGEQTAASTLDRAVATLRAVGREPVVLRGDVPGLVSNRLTAALLREALDLISRGVIDAADLDRLVARRARHEPRRDRR